MTPDSTLAVTNTCPKDGVHLILDGLQHGHFECSVSCTLGNGGRREVVIRAGKSERFTILKEELPHL